MNTNSHLARAHAEAAKWWVRIESGEFTREEREQFVDWLRESVVHVAEMLRMAEVHGTLEHFPHWVRIETAGAPQATNNVVPFNAAAAESADEARSSAQSSVTGKRTTRRRWATGIGLAATLAALGVGLMVFFSAQVIETSRAERRNVTLADGSILQIDPESRLRIRLEDNQRDIYLERGRAMFRVARDPARPFSVHAEKTEVRVLGTQFGVEQARDGVVITVTEGKVAVRRGDSSSARADTRNGHEGSVATARPATERDPSSEVLLSAGQQVIVPRVGPAQSVRVVDADRELSWVAGRLIFDDESVADVIDEFNRYNVVQLHVASAQLAQRSVSGVFDASQPESFIGFMQSVAPVNVRRAGQDITIALAP